MRRLYTLYGMALGNIAKKIKEVIEISKLNDNTDYNYHE